MPSTAFFQTNLVSDIPGVAQITDPNLKNPWGVAVNPTGDFWVSDAANGTVTLYGGDVNGQPIRMDAPVIMIPAAKSGSQGQPSGQVLNSTQDFVVPGTGSAAFFIFAGLDGTLTVVTPNFNTGGPTSQAMIVATVKGASYTGLALGSNASGNFLFAANKAAGTIDVFDKNFKLTTLSSNFTDSKLPPNLTPFNVANLNGTLYVTYVSASNRTVGGVVDKFDTNGNFLGRFADAGSNLVAPWAVVQAPANFGSFGSDILVGNFGDGHVSAYDPTSGHFLGQLNGQDGQPLAIDRLWQLTFGNGSASGGSSTLYFTSGLNKEQDGVLGSLTPMTANQRFVAQVYHDLLQRPVEAPGLAFWTNQLTQGTSRQQIVAGVQSSGEYRALVVNRLFNQYLHRPADATGLSFWTTRLAAGATFEQVAAGIAGSQEFLMAQGRGTNDGFLTAFYQDALGRAIDTSGQMTFSAALQNGVTTGQVAAAVLGSSEFLTDQVQGFFQSFLHRAADSDGLRFFVPALQHGATDQQVIAGVLASVEYFSRL